jgi:hypothetical protein
MPIRKLFVASILATSLLSLALAQTTTTSTQTLTFPVMAVAVSETVQINVVNTATSSSATAASCTGTIAFLDANGSALGAATSFTAAAGRIASASRAYLTLNGSGARVLIRGIVTLTTASTSSTTSTSTTPCSLGATMETYDSSTGVTHVMASAAGNSGGTQQGGTPPSGTPPGGTGGQQPPTGGPGGN